MNREPRFLSITEVIEIHENEIKEAGGLSGIRDRNNLESAVAAPQASTPPYDQTHLPRGMNPQSNHFL